MSLWLNGTSNTPGAFERKRGKIIEFTCMQCGCSFFEDPAQEQDVTECAVCHHSGFICRSVSALTTVMEDREQET